MIKELLKKIDRKKIIIFLSILLFVAISTFAILLRTNVDNKRMVSGVNITPINQISEPDQTRTVSENKDKDTESQQPVASPSNETPNSEPEIISNSSNTPLDLNQNSPSNENKDPNTDNQPNTPPPSDDENIPPPKPADPLCKPLNSETPSWSGARSLVKRGELIGNVGATGLTGAPRLDLYYVTDSNKKLDPSSLINQNAPIESGLITYTWKFGDNYQFGGYNKTLSYYIFQAPFRTPIYAIKDGELVYDGYQRGFGNTKIYAHKDCTYTFYTHLVP